MWRGNPIEWRVLDTSDGNVLLISKDILALRQYDSLERWLGKGWYRIEDIPWEKVKLTWAVSEIRNWLNNDFLNEAFSVDEQNSIILSTISNPDNEEYGTDGGPDTKDKVFLLSIDEAERFFHGDDDRIAEFEMTKEDYEYMLPLFKEQFDYTSFAQAERSIRDRIGNKDPYPWRLRSPGLSGAATAWVNAPGDIINSYSEVGPENFIGIRPALWLRNG